jgi:hypothetical protein
MFVLFLAFFPLTWAALSLWKIGGKLGWIFCFCAGWDNVPQDLVRLSKTNN